MNDLKSIHTNEENREEVLVCLFQGLCRYSRLRATEQVQCGIATSGWLQVDPRCEDQERSDIVEWMQTEEKVFGTYHEYTRSTGERLIVGYSELRAKKDAYNGSADFSGW